MNLRDFFQGRPKKRKAENWTPTNHQPNTEYLRDVAQIPDSAAYALARGYELAPEMELECDRTIEEAKEQIKRVAPPRYGTKLPTVVRISRRRFFKGLAE